jgi:hypothetical protein
MPLQVGLREEGSAVWAARASCLQADLDPTNQISGFEEIETDGPRPDLAPAGQARSVLCESPADQARPSAGRARQILSASGSIENEPVRLTERIAAPGLQALHDSGSIIAAVHCFRIVLSIGLRFAAMQFCLVARELGGRPAWPPSRPSRRVSRTGVPSFLPERTRIHE